MSYERLNAWDVAPSEAARIQEDLRNMITMEDDLGTVRIVAGVDASYSRSGGTATGGVVALRYPELKVVEAATATEEVRFPYIPGLLSFREAPAVLAAFKMLKAKPDLLIVDGQGFAHPRRFGLACHLGLVLDTPTIGCAKSCLIGEYTDPGPEVGSTSPLVESGEQIGVVLRSRTGVKPLFISVGHRVSLESAVRLVLACGRGSRVPEPTRLADRLVSHARPASFF